MQSTEECLGGQRGLIMLLITMEITRLAVVLQLYGAMSLEYLSQARSTLAYSDVCRTRAAVPDNEGYITLVIRGLERKVCNLQ